MLCLTFLHVSLVYYFSFYDSHIASCNKNIIQVIIGNFVTQTLSEKNPEHARTTRIDDETRDQRDLPGLDWMQSCQRCIQNPVKNLRWSIRENTEQL